MHIIFPVKNLVPPSRLSEVTFTYSVTLESLLSHIFYQVKSHHIPVEQIERDLADIETNMAHLEQEGVGLEKQLRRCEEGTLFPSLCIVRFSLHSQFHSFPGRSCQFPFLAANKVDTN